MIPAASVDAVFASNVYEHFQSREQVPKASPRFAVFFELVASS